MASAIKTFFNATEVNLKKVGFEFQGYFESDLSEKTTHYMGIFVHPETKDFGMTTANFVGSGKEIRFQSNTVEFSAVFEDGREVITYAGSAVELMGKGKNRQLILLPNGTPSHQTFLTHRLLSGLHPEGRRAETDRDPNPAVILQNALRKYFARQVPLGYLKLNRTGKWYLPTLKGAYLMTWKLLWPVKAILARQRKREGNYWLAQALEKAGSSGMEGFAPEMVHEMKKQSGLFTSVGMAGMLQTFFIFTILLNGYYYLTGQQASVFNFLTVAAIIGLIVLRLAKPGKKKGEGKPGPSLK